MLVQLADLGQEACREAWGDDFITASAVIHYLRENAVGFANAKTSDVVAAGVLASSYFSGSCQGLMLKYYPKKIPSVLHKLSQGVAHGAVRRSGESIRFFLHTDADDRLEEERGLDASIAGGRASAGTSTTEGVPGLRLKPCVTDACPFAGTWEPPPDDNDRATFPVGPKCCGSCTGTRKDGRPMQSSHGVRCGRTPWLGIPAIDLKDMDWLGITNTSQLNEELNRAFGTARLVQHDIDDKCEGVVMHTAFPNRVEDGQPVIVCQLRVVDTNGGNEWVTEMTANSKSLARLRAFMAFLHCYKTLLVKAAEGPPVSYPAVWQATLEELRVELEAHTPWVDVAPPVAEV